MLEKLIGYQLVEFDEGGFTVEKDGNRLHFEFNLDDGDCCGHAHIFGELLISTDDISRNPVITNVEREEKVDDRYDEMRVRICFFGENKKIAQINSDAGSMSGWRYGACAWVTCTETGEDEELASW